LSRGPLRESSASQHFENGSEPDSESVTVSGVRKKSSISGISGISSRAKDDVVLIDGDDPSAIVENEQDETTTGIADTAVIYRSSQQPLRPNECTSSNSSKAEGGRAPAASSNIASHAIAGKGTVIGAPDAAPSPSMARHSRIMGTRQSIDIDARSTTNVAAGQKAVSIQDERTHQAAATQSLAIAPQGDTFHNADAAREENYSASLEVVGAPVGPNERLVDLNITALLSIT